jgi:predicted nucleic acid-binding Zn ribbon protein
VSEEHVTAAVTKTLAHCHSLTYTTLRRKQLIRNRRWHQYSVLDRQNPTLLEVALKWITSESDLIGGLAGDMFGVAMIAAFPRHEVVVSAAIPEDAALCCSLQDCRDLVLRGRRFALRATKTSGNFVFKRQHHHAIWASIQSRLSTSTLG